MLAVVYGAFTSIISTCIYLALAFIIIVFTLKSLFEPTKAMCRCKARLDNKVALVTGGNSGIGLETARELASRGARVIIAGSNDGKSKKAVEDIVATTGNKNVEYKHLDLSKFRSIRQFAEDFNKNMERLDILVNNAGVIVGNYTTEDGINAVMQINYLGPFLLTLSLLEKLKQSKPSRIINLSSRVHYVSYLDPEDLRGMNYIFFSIWFRYANSKLCNVLFTKALSERLPIGVTVNSLHPGLVKTNLFGNLHPVLRYACEVILKYACFKSPKEGAQTSIHVCVCPDLNDVSGEYFSECKPRKTSQLAYNNVIVEQVWRNSIQLIENHYITT